MLALKDSMNLAGSNLIHTLAPENSYLPIWSVTIERDMRAWSEANWPAHNIGRWWDAMLRLEAATGFAIPAELEGAIERQIVDTLAAVNEHLQKLSEAKDEFVANVSHELRTPIANLKLYHHLLVSYPAKQESYIGTLERETSRLEKLVEDLLYLSELDRQEIKERVYQVVSTVLKVEPSQIQENHVFTSDLGAESVQSVELVAGFEQQR